MLQYKNRGIIKMYTVYLIHDLNRNLLKIGATSTMTVRLNTWRRALGPLFLIGYIGCETKAEAFELESKFIRKQGRRGRLPEWREYDSNVVESFCALDGCVEKNKQIEMRRISSITKDGGMDRGLKKKIMAWKLKIGRQEAEKRLVAAGLSLSLTQKLLSGTYPNTPKMALILLEMAMKDPAA